MGISWDEAVPPAILRAYKRWRTELRLLSTKVIHCCYFRCHPRDCQIQLHGFSDASEEAYASVVYFCIQAPGESTHVSLVMSKTRVTPLKRLSIPQLELCGALLLARILTHIQRTLEISSCDTYAWTDSTVVLGWLSGDPRRYKTFVGNRVSQIVDNVAPNRWSHVAGYENPADCASRGLLPSELIDHHLWRTGPTWLHQDQSYWPSRANLSFHSAHPKESELACFVSVDQPTELVDFGRYSSYSHLKRVVAWMVCFIHNSTPGCVRQFGPLTVHEFKTAELHLWLEAQADDFLVEKRALQLGSPLPRAVVCRHCIPSLKSLDSYE